MDNNTNTGAIKGKIPLCDLAAKYHDAYTAIFRHMTAHRINP